MNWPARVLPRLSRRWSLPVVAVAADLAPVLMALTLAGVLAGGVSCSKVAPTAPSGSTLTLTVSPAAIVSSSGTATVDATLRLPDGLSQPGAQVQFSTTLGSVNPTLATTDNNGLAVAKLVGDGRVGTAKVMAYSGAVMSTEFDVMIGTEASTITLQAQPATIPSTGASVRLVALVRDATGLPVAGAQVNFTTNVGRLASGGGIVTANANGQANDTLIIQAGDIGAATSITVTANSASNTGALQTATFTVNIITNLAATITVGANPQFLSLDGGTVTLTALVRNTSGNAVPGAGVQFQASLGTLGNAGLIFTDSTGLASTTLNIPSVTQNPTVVNITATTAGAGSVIVTSNTATVTLQSSGSAHR